MDSDLVKLLLLLLVDPQTPQAEEMTNFAVFLHALQCESQLNHAQKEVLLVGGVETANLVKAVTLKLSTNNSISVLLYQNSWHVLVAHNFCEGITYFVNWLLTLILFKALKTTFRKFILELFHDTSVQIFTEAAQLRIPSWPRRQQGIATAIIQIGY